MKSTEYDLLGYFVRRPVALKAYGYKGWDKVILREVDGTEWELSKELFDSLFDPVDPPGAEDYYQDDDE